tara:strand:+ start:1944 stop:3017 length:1074 start_codon:yes stop_codon:yes gene_type:complete
MSKIKKIDFVWSSKKDYNSLVPLHRKFIENGWDCRLQKVHRNKLLNHSIKHLSSLIVIAYSGTYYRLKKSGWNGEFVYIDHGVNPIKYYSYIYDFFYKSSLLFYPGNIFKEKMTILNNNFKNGLIGGFTVMDDLINTTIDKLALIKKLKLNPKKPIILFAPTWGSKKSKKWGVNNNRYFSNLDNLITIPHPADYNYSKFKKGIIVPKNREHLNQILHLADIVISDISSLILEASAINKITIQIEMKKYPGCFPDIDIDDSNIIINKKILSDEINKTNRAKKPFKISFLDKELIVDYTSSIDNIKDTINKAIKEPNKNLSTRRFWTNQCCWKPDGNTNERIFLMIKNFIKNKKIEQLN